MIRHLPDEAATIELGRCLHRALLPGTIVFLSGNLGAGKTTLVRGYLRAAGFRGPVKSPTFTLVEEYPLDGCTVYHFDLYRLGSAEELEGLGFRDYPGQGAICFIEWPERGEGALPEPDLDLSLELEGSGRKATVIAHTDAGHAALARIESAGRQ